MEGKKEENKVLVYFRDKKIEYIRKILLYVALTIWLIRETYYFTSQVLNRLGIYMTSEDKAMLIKLTLLCVFVVCILGEIRLYEIALCVISYITYIQSDNEVFALFVFFSIALKDIDIKPFIRHLFRYHVIFITICIVVYSILLSRGSNLAKVIIDDRVRYSFFFNHSNPFGMMIAAVMMSTWYLYFEKIPSWLLNMISLLLMIFVWEFPKCRTAVVVMVLMVGLYNIRRISKEYTQILVNCILFLGTFFCVFCMWKYWTGNWVGVGSGFVRNFMMRFADGVLNLVNHDLTLFGQKVNTFGKSLSYGKLTRRVSLDFAYAMMYLYTGVIGSIVFVFVLLKAWIKLNQSKQIDEMILLLVVLLYGLCEWPIMIFSVGFPLVFCKDVFKKKRLMYKNVF